MGDHIDILELNISRCTFDDDGVSDIFKNLGNNCLKKAIFWLEKVPLNHELVINLKEFFKTQPQLYDLEVYFNYSAMDSSGIKHLIDSMKFDCLQNFKLGLRGCGLDNPCVLTLASTLLELKVNYSLSLDLGGNILLEQEAKKLAESISKFDELKKFS